MSAPARAGNRDTRLLIATLAVSAGMLLILARFRFPERAVAPEAGPAPAPLERLAARATYDELAGVLGALSRQVAPGIAAFRAGPSGAGNRQVELPAIRLGAERAVALVGAGRSVDDLAGGDVEGVLAVDAPRGLALLKVVPGSAAPLNDAIADEDLAAPGYAAAVEMTRGGPAVRPFYFGRVDREASDPRWGRPLWRFTAVQQMPPAGSAIYLLDGRFVGLGAPDDRGFLVVPGVVLLERAEGLATSGSVWVADLGIEIAALSPDLKSALGVDTGVAVTHVIDEGPARGKLQAGDVLVRVAGAAIASDADYRAALGTIQAGADIAVEGVRRGDRFTAAIAPAGRGRVAAETSRLLGLDLRALRDAGSEVVRVAPQSAGAVAGMAAGDVITMIGRTTAPSPAAVERGFRDAPDGARMVVAVQRGGRHLLLVLAKP